MRKYRRIKRNEKNILQSYQITLIAFGMTFLFTLLFLYISHAVTTIEFLSKIQPLFNKIAFGFGVISFLSLVLTLFFYTKREEISLFNLPDMPKAARKIANKIQRLFTDKQIIDVLKMSNSTRYGDEMPEIFVWIDDKCTSGYIAIENIGNYEVLDRTKYEQKLSGILSGKMKRFAVVSSELTEGDTYMLFYIEDVLTSDRLHVQNKLEKFINDDSHAIQVSKSLTIHFDLVPHMSIVARTRAGKTFFAGRYLAPLMILQGWTVEYNSAKTDKYVKEFNGKSRPEEIVERTEFWVEVMKERLAKIEVNGKEKYLDIVGMNDVAIFFDELANLNAELEMDKLLKKRWETAINKLTSSGASAGIHVIAISQFATKEAFLPSTARVNCSDATIMLGGAADSGDERRYLMPGFSDMPKKSYGKGQGIARILGSGKKWEVPHYFEAPWFGE